MLAWVSTQIIIFLNNLYKYYLYFIQVFAQMLKQKEIGDLLISS